MNSTHQSKADILIVDDTPDNLRLLSAMLSERKYDVRSVTNGSTALMGIRAQSPDLILLDITMPGLNGYEVCQHLKADSNTKDIPVIFISALDEIFDKVKAFSVGGVDYITKPFQVEEVVVRVENQLKVRRLQIQLSEALAQERALNQRIEKLATIEERNRIARDIHDSLGHSLVALNIQMETALTLWPLDPDKAYTFLKEAKQLGTEALQAVRQSVSDIRADDALQGKLLEQALAKLSQEFHNNTGILPNCKIDLSYSLSDSVSTGVYRIVQEGFTNICKHAKASSVQLQVKSTEKEVLLLLKDNGKGMDINKFTVGYGLQGMRERVAIFGGIISIMSEPGKGCQIKAKLPRLAT